MKTKNFVMKGDICFSEDRNAISCRENHYLVCVEGVSRGVFAKIPDEYRDLPLYDYSGQLIIPGFTDLHVHAPQFAFRGLGMDQELLDWLNTRTFPEEAKYVDMDYARQAYRIFTDQLVKSATTRAVVFATLHLPATIKLMEMLDQAGMAAYVGKVNMDRNSPDNLREETASSIRKTERFIEETADRFARVKPILTPRFVPSCSDELMAALGRLQKKYGLPVQSHLSENMGEVAWVGELCPEAKFYGQAYDQYGLFGGGAKTIMAHCVHSSPEEIALMSERGVYAAHCPASNTNLSSGIAPIRAFLEAGVPVGLGSDIAGGHTLSMFNVMVQAIQVSKLKWRLSDESLKPLTMAEVFWLGTAGGGSFFGKTGSFLAGYELDALVLDEGSMPYPGTLSAAKRLERFIYLADARDIAHKFIAGTKLF